MRALEQDKAIFSASTAVPYSVWQVTFRQNYEPAANITVGWHFDKCKA